MKNNQSPDDLTRFPSENEAHTEITTPNFKERPNVSGKQSPPKEHTVGVVIANVKPPLQLQMQMPRYARMHRRKKLANLHELCTAAESI